MSIEEISETLTDALVSHAQTLGLFETVNRHEFKNAPPGGGLHGNVWFSALAPFPGASTLTHTAARLAFTFRLYGSMLDEPQDDIDRNMLQALDKLLAAYSADFTLDGLVRNVDLLGEAGIPLGAQSGYLTIGNKMMRVIDVTIPLIISDAWTQEA